MGYVVIAPEVRALGRSVQYPAHWAAWSPGNWGPSAWCVPSPLLEMVLKIAPQCWLARPPGPPARLQERSEVASSTWSGWL